MTRKQFYNCLKSFIELREKINETYNVRIRAQVSESIMYEDRQVDFDSLRRIAETKRVPTRILRRPTL